MCPGAAQQNAKPRSACRQFQAWVIKSCCCAAAAAHDAYQSPSPQSLSVSCAGDDDWNGDVVRGGGGGRAAHVRTSCAATSSCRRTAVVNLVANNRKIHRVMYSHVPLLSLTVLCTGTGITGISTLTVPVVPAFNLNPAARSRAGLPASTSGHARGSRSSSNATGAQRSERHGLTRACMQRGGGERHGLPRAYSIDRGRQGAMTTHSLFYRPSAFHCKGLNQPGGGLK
eukprot:SAG22_NODE_16_length_32723_cov_26.404825_28_plen_228_part_00